MEEDLLLSLLQEGKITYKETKRIIYEAMENEQLVLFVGAGASVDSGMPLWKEAISKIAEKMQLTDDQNDYLKVPQYYYNSRGKKEYTQLMRDIFKYEDCLLPTELHKTLLDLNTSTIITTNYDHLIEKAAEENGQFIRVVSQDVDMPYRKSKKELIKMHGDFEHDNFVLKEDDYLNYSRNFKLIETYVKSIIGSKVVLFVGYSLNDPDVLHIISWVKDILKDDFQRAYLILTKMEQNDIQKDYFRNLGINIIYANELVEQHDIGHSEQLIEVINFLKEKEDTSKLDELYDELKPFEELNFVYGKYIANAFRKHGIICREDNTLDMTNNSFDSLNNPLRDAIWEAVKLNEKNDDVGKDDSEEKKNPNSFDIKKINSIISVCGKSRYSSISRVEKNKCNTQKLNNVEISDIEKKISEFDYEGLRGILNDNNVKLSLDKPDLYMEQAYISAFLNEYCKAYNYLKIAAHAYYSRRMYAKYFIAEFDRKYIGKVMLSPFVLQSIPAEEQDQYEDEIKAIDLERILKSIPNIGNNNNEFLYELNNFTISYTLFYNVYEDSLKTNEQASTAYSLFTGTAAYQSLREKIRDFERYETCNYIFLDNYKENKSIFDLYIRTIMSSINASNISNDDIGEPCGNIKPDTLTDFDIYIALRYIQRKELITYFKEYGIKKLPVSESAISYIEKISKSICDESIVQRKTIYETDRFWTFLEILNHTVVTENIIHNVFKRLLLIKSEMDIISYRDTLNRLFVRIIEEKLYENKEVCKQANRMVNLLLEFFSAKDNNNNVFFMYLIRNLLYFINEGGLSYNNINMIKKLVKNDSRKILFACFTYLNDREQIIVKNAYAEWKPQNNHIGDYYQYCEGVLAEVIVNDARVEMEIVSWLSSMIENSKKEDHSNILYIGGLSHLSILKQLINLYLDNKIINVENLKKVTYESDDEMSKWLLDLNEFDYNKFECSWLGLCGDKLLKSIVENPEVKQNIISAYKKQYDSLSESDKVSDIIVKYFI